MFGINDDRTSCGAAPPDFKVDHDLVAGIVKKYLEPPMHCDVRPAMSACGVEHAVLVVPPHGATPICAKANGPEINGKVSGIVAGTYYLRKPGPESAPIVSAAEWRDLIRRCALHERAAILAAITAALAGSQAGASPDAAILVGKRLEALATAADRDYLSVVGEKTLAAPVRDCRVQFSYLIETENGEALPFRGLANVLREVSNEVDQHVKSGWSLFYVFNVASAAPQWRFAPGSEDDEFLETNLIDSDRTIGFDLWRVSPQGWATVIREFWEDTPDFGIKPRTVVNPRMMARALGELVRHAESFSSRFSVPLRVEFRCEWRGLSGRHLSIPNAIPIFTTVDRATVDYVVTSGGWAIGALASETPEIVAKLGGRVARALGWEGFTPEWIANEVPGWRRL